jgi:hypothetical protein
VSQKKILQVRNKGRKEAKTRPLVICTLLYSIP